MSKPRLLIACVGNIFLGDDAFGVEVARRLVLQPLPEAVRVVDFGIRGLDLAYTLLEDYEAVLLVDAVPRGGKPGTLYVLEVDPSQCPEDAGPGAGLDTHDMDPVKVLRLVATLGGRVRRLLVVGCEPMLPTAAEDMQMGLSEAMNVAVDDAIPLIESLIDKLLHHEPVAVDTMNQPNNSLFPKEV